MSKKQKKEEETEEAIKDVLPVVGAAVGGPVGGAVGIAAGMVQGSAEEVKKKKIEILPYEYMGYIRAFFRTCGFIFIALGTFFIFWNAPLLKFIPLIVLSIAITSNPYGTARTDMEVGLSVLNMLLGVLMVLFFGLIFFDIVNSGQYTLYFSLLLISAGFFITIPFSKEDREDSASRMLKYFGEAGEKFGKNLRDSIKIKSGGILKIIFWLIIGIIFIYFLVAFVGVAFAFISLDLAGTIENGLALALGTVMTGLSIIMGIKFGRTLNGMILGILGGIGILFGTFALMSNLIAFIIFSLVVGMGILASVPVDRLKTFIGIPIVMIALMTTTLAYPDVMGTTVFGPWWPTIDYTLDNTLGPLLQNMRSPLETMGTGYQCLINPVQCYQNYEPQTSTKKSIRSVEVTRLDVMGDDVIDKSPDTMIIIATIENKGKEDAENIKVVPWVPFYSQGIDVGVNAGTVDIRCENGSVIQFSEFDYNKDGCNIPKLLAGEIREFVLTYNLDKLIKGNYVSYGANVTYDLNLKGQVDVMVMDEDYYYKLARNSELSRKEQVTEDTGGPVRLGLALMRNEMPVKDDLEGVPVLLFLDNQGPGILKDIKSAEVDISDIEGVETHCKPPPEALTEDTKLVDLDEYMSKYSGDDVKEIPSYKSLSSTCISKVPDISVDQRTFAITGDVNYTYMHSMERKIMVDFGAWVTCVCGEKTYLMYSCDQCGSGCTCETGENGS